MADSEITTPETLAAANRPRSESVQLFLNGLWKENPVMRQLLGMCPTLAVTGAVKNALTMGLATLFVLLCSNIVVSLLRKLLKPHVRILMYTITIASFVSIADWFLAAYIPEMSRVLGPYVPLIIVNCVIISRAEACSSKKGLVASILDALGMGIGFTLALLMLSTVREILGHGSVWGYRVMWKSYEPMVVMILPAGAFITLGILIGIANMLKSKSAKGS